MRFGHWETTKELGAGGQGKVYLAYNLDKFNLTGTIAPKIADLIKGISAAVSTRERQESYRNELVQELIKLIGGYDDDNNYGAIKKLHNEAAARDYATALPRMKREIEALKLVSHKNITQILDSNIDEHWFVTEFYRKGNLGNNKKLFLGNIIKTLKAFKALAEGVGELHKKGLVHRDIKPENIFLSNNDELILGDFGLVFFSDELHTRISETFENVGSRDWMPGWAMGMKIEDVKASFDVFSLGKILWYMLSKIEKMQLWYYNKPAFNLEEMYPDNYSMKLVNEILEYCVVEEEKDCVKTATDLIELIDSAVNKIELKADLLSKEDLERPCRVCGEGKYTLIVNENITHTRNFGLEPHGPAAFKIFTCNNCGNIQLFHIPSTSARPPLWE